MGRPGTPGPGERAAGEAGESRATFSGAVVLLGIVSFVLGVIAVAVPYWGHFRPPGAAQQYGTSYFGQPDNSGFFGPFNKCQYQSGGYIKNCGPTVKYQIQVYLRIAGVCGIVAVVATAAFCLFAGLHCAMQVNNKHIGLKYSKNVFLAFLSAVIAEIATLFAVAIAAPQFIKRQQFVSELGSCYYIEITLLLFNLLLCVLSYLSYTRARKTNFPRQREPYEITGEHYGNEALAGQQLGRGITVTANSGVHYSGGEAQLGPGQLPAFPSPAATNGYHYTNGGTVQLGQRAGPQQPVGYSAPVAAVPPTIRLAPRIESPGCGVNLNPGGRAGGRPSGLSGPGVGSMDSLNSTQDSVLSFGSTVSTGSYNSQGQPSAHCKWSYHSKNDVTCFTQSL